VRVCRRRRSNQCVINEVSVMELIFPRGWSWSMVRTISRRSSESFFWIVCRFECNAIFALILTFATARDVQELEIHDEKVLRHFVDGHQCRRLPSIRQVLSIRHSFVGIVRPQTTREQSVLLLLFMQFSYKAGNLDMRNQQTSRQLLVVFDFAKGTNYNQ
jgi:hypothetical protein